MGEIYDLKPVDEEGLPPSQSQVEAYMGPDKSILSEQIVADPIIFTDATADSSGWLAGADVPTVSEPERPKYPPDVEILKRKVPGYERAWLVRYANQIYLLERTRRDYGPSFSIRAYPSNMQGQKLLFDPCGQARSYARLMRKMDRVRSWYLNGLEYRSTRRSVLAECHTFYVLQALLAPGRHYEGISAGKLLVDLQEMYEVHERHLAWALADYLTLTAFGEARNAKGACNTWLGDIPSRNDMIRSDAYTLARAYDPLDFLPKLVKLFNEGNWSSSFGGEKWGAIAKAAYQFRVGQDIQWCKKRGGFPSVRYDANTVKTLSALTFIDTCWALAHNGGPCFDKGCVFAALEGPAQTSLASFLDSKRSDHLEEWGMLILPGRVQRLLCRAEAFGVVDLSNIIFGISGYKSSLDGYKPIEFGKGSIGDFGYKKKFVEDKVEDEFVGLGEPAKAVAIISKYGPKALINMLDSSSDEYMWAKAQTMKSLSIFVWDYSKACSCSICKKYQEHFAKHYIEKFVDTSEEAEPLMDIQEIEESLLKEFKEQVVDVIDPVYIDKLEGDNYATSEQTKSKNWKATLSEDR